MAESPDEYKEFVLARAAELNWNEFWCITHEAGELRDTASKDVTRPIAVVCKTRGADWDDLTGAGYGLGKVVLTNAEMASVREDVLFGDVVKFLDYRLKTIN